MCDKGFSTRLFVTSCCRLKLTGQTTYNEFVASTAFEVQYQMLKVYLAGIKHHHQLAGLPDPIETFIRLPLVL